MALTQVRAKLGEEWVTLTYNPSTGRYEGYLTPPGTSIHQPGGYYNIEVDATNQGGDVARISGEQLPSLRLVVRETTAPVLTLISPAPGYLQTQTPTFIFEAVDEAGGSGVDPETFSLEGAVVEPITNGYRFTWTPPVPWSEGGHTVTAAVRDYDGNESTVSGAYSVDTVPPVLLIRKPDAHRVVDVDHVEIAAQAWDDGSGVASVTVTPSVSLTADSSLKEGAIAPRLEGGGPEGRWEFTVPLEIGENRLLVTAEDAAGNRTTQEVYMIRLVTDRTQADIAALTNLYQRPVEEWTESELEWFNTAPCLRGSYDAEDLNRVGVAVRYLSEELRKRGYIADTAPKTNWTRQDAPVRGQMDTYLNDVVTIRDAQPVYIPVETPPTMRKSTINDWNNIEKALVEADSFFPNYTAWTSGEITCGGV